MRKTITLFFGIWSFMFCISAFSQNYYEQLLPSRLDFSNEKPKDFKGKILVLEEDTLFAKKHSAKDLSFLKPSQYNYQNIIEQYQLIAFYPVFTDTKNSYYLPQWSSDIVVYLDPKLPEEVKVKFEKFYSDVSLKNVKNLKISFTNQLKNANYQIKTTEEDINGYEKDFEFKTEQDRRKNMYTGATYSLHSDKNRKYYAATLYINPKKIGTNELVLKRLKRVFYYSLGNFSTALVQENKNSLLDQEYNNSHKISTFDLNILSIHYGVLYDHLVDYHIHRRLTQLATQHD